MFLKKKIRLFKTLKFKITLLYTALFVISFLFLFVFTFNSLELYLINRMDQRLQRSMTRITERLSVIDKNSSSDSLKVIPEPIIAKTKKLINAFELKSARKARLNNQDYFVFLGVTTTMVYEVWMDPKGDLYQLSGVELLPEPEFLENEFMNEAHFYGTDHIYFLFLDSKGGIISKSELDGWGDLENTPFPFQNTQFKSYTTEDHDTQANIRVLNIPLHDGFILQGGIKLNEEYDLLSRITILFFSLLIVILVSGVMFSWIISRKAMVGIKRVVKTSNNIGKDNLSYRVEVGDEGEEIGELVDSFNNMLSRIETLVFELKEISDNIAHDLRTPLTRIRGIIETTVNSQKVNKDIFNVFGEILEECDRLTNIINIMLEITQNDTGLIQLNKKKINLNSIMEEAYELFLPLAEMKQLIFRLHQSSEIMKIHGDSAKIQRMIANLIDNAIKFTPDHGEITISLTQNNKNACLTIKDTGIGISPEDEKFIFERFYRCENSRFLPGNGLGLSLAASIARVHHGEIHFTANENKGSSFIIILPLC